MKHTLKIAVLMLAAVLTACGGKPSVNTKPGLPLDPQGNWLFNVNGTSTALQFAGQLFEITAPVVTSNQMAAFTTSCGNMTFSVGGQASGVNSIGLTVSRVNPDSTAFTLDGTIADSQAAMSGTWTSTSPCVTDTTGTWSAVLLAPVTRTWTGTASNGDTVTAVLSENTDQTSVNMGQVTGTITVSGPCFANSLTATGGHLGEQLNLSTQPDTNGAALSASANVDPSATAISGTGTVTGGPCDGTSFTATLQ